MAQVNDQVQMNVESLIRDHQSAIWQYLRYLGADRAEADDLTQETFLALMRGAFEYRGDEAARRYLRQVARNQLLMLRRRQGKELDTVQLEFADQAWCESVEKSGVDRFLELLADCRDKLNGRSREVIDLFYGDGLGRGDAAKKLDMSPGGIKTLLRRTRATLRACVEKGIDQ